MSHFESWPLSSGKRRRVAVLNRHLGNDDACPECGYAIAVAIAKTVGDRQVFRLECLSCHWTTDALPDPERDGRPFKQRDTEGTS